jgi:hypothetical protein
MGKECGRNMISCIASYCVLILLAAGPAGGGSGPGADAGRDAAKGQWTRIVPVGRYSVRGEVGADKDLSGIACISDRYCLIGADEGRDVQVVELRRDAQALRIVETVSLLSSGPEIDIEAIAAEGDYYYIVGSHGISKKQGERQNNRCRVFRLKVDPKTGVPKGLSIAGLRRPSGLDVASLADVIRADPVLGPYFGQPLQQKGINIEGLAVRNGRLFVGFRNPNVGGDAFVLEVAADEVFGSRTPPARPWQPALLHRLHLGEGLGIREIVAAKSGFLLIAGNAGSEPSEKFTDAEDYAADRDFFLFDWDGKTPEVHKIGPIPDPAGKAEAMTILEETADHITVLILYDGAKRGRPTVYRVE